VRLVGWVGALGVVCGWMGAVWGGQEGPPSLCPPKIPRSPPVLGLVPMAKLLYLMSRTRWWQAPPPVPAQGAHAMEVFWLWAPGYVIITQANYIIVIL
jgi:hypothetical protein